MSTDRIYRTVACTRCAKLIARSSHFETAVCHGCRAREASQRDMERRRKQKNALPAEKN